MAFIVNSYKKENIVENRREYIAISLHNLRTSTFHFEAFKQVFQGMNIAADSTLLEKVHLRIAEYAFRAYTKQKNNHDFNKVKALASDKTNLCFRTIIQTGGKDGKEELDDANSKPNNNQVLQSLGMKEPSKPRAKTKSPDDVKKELEAPFADALDKLIKHDGKPDKLTKLSKKDCAAILTLGFGVFTRPTTNEKVGDLRNSVGKKMKETFAPNKKPRFWTDLEKRKASGGSGSKKRKRTETDESQGPPPAPLT